jgi:hypothetical protein
LSISYGFWKRKRWVICSSLLLMVLTKVIAAAMTIKNIGLPEPLIDKTVLFIYFL